MLYTLLIVALVVLDQVVKLWTRSTLPLGSSMPFIPHVMDLAYVQNTGAAFSFMAEHTWLLTLISAVVSVVLAVILARKVFPDKIAMVTLSLVLAGAIGNLIDRALFGFVTDMFKTTFMNFAVFNVADICVVCGGILFAIYYIFAYQEPEEKEEHHDHPGTDTPE